MEKGRETLQGWVLNIHNTCSFLVLDVRAQALAARAFHGGPCEETRTAPVLDTAASCPLQWTHHRAKLSPPGRMWHL